MAGQGLSRSDLLTKTRDILADVIDNEGLELSETTTAEDVADWDSINHVRLLLGLESDLGIRFATSEVQGLKNVGQLIDLMQQKLAS